MFCLGLTVVSTLRANNTIQASLVNAGVLKHPENRSPVLTFVTYGRVKLANLRARPQLAATFRSWFQVSRTFIGKGSMALTQSRPMPP